MKAQHQGRPKSVTRDVTTNVTTKEKTCMTSGKRLALALGIGMVTLLASLSAQAQYAPPPQYGSPPPPYGAPPPPYYPPPPPPQYGVYRAGLTLGFGLGAGAVLASNCGDICGAAGAGEFHIGVMLNPRMAVMGDFWLNIHPWSIDGVSGQTLHSISTAAIQYWATPQLWIKGGAGLGRMQIRSDDYYGYSYAIGDETGFAVMAAGGFEIMQAPNFALDLQLRFGHGFYSGGGDVNNFAFMVGFNWY
jgi:hypothetical protein